MYIGSPDLSNTFAVAGQVLENAPLQGLMVCLA